MLKMEYLNCKFDEGEERTMGKLTIVDIAIVRVEKFRVQTLNTCTQ